MFHAYFEEAQMALLNFFVLFYQMHIISHLCLGSPKNSVALTSIGRMVLGESLESCSIQCSTVSFYIAKIIVTANCQTFVWQILQPRHYLLQLIQLCALSLKKKPEAFCYFQPYYLSYKTTICMTQTIKNFPTVL